MKRHWAELSVPPTERTLHLTMLMLSARWKTEFRVKFLMVMTLMHFAAPAGAATCDADRIAGTCESVARARLNTGHPTNNKLVAMEIKEKARALILARSSADDPATKAILQRLDTVTFREATADDEACQGKPNRQIAPGSRAHTHRHYARATIDAASLSRPPDTEETPNAFYNDGNHSVIACPSAMRLSAGAWASMFAHELGHVVSPCTLAKDTYRKAGNFDPAAPEQVKRAVKRCLGARTPPPVLEMTQELLTGTGATTMIFPDRQLEPEFAAVLKKLRACGLMERTQEAQVAISPLFEDVERCLQHKNRSNFKKMKTSANRAIREGRESEHVNGFARPDAYPAQCFGATEEEFADAFGSEVYGAWLEERDDARTRSTEAVTQMRKLQCLTKKDKPEPNADWFYPNFKTRLFSIMNSAQFQKAQNCRIEENSRCSWKAAGAPATGAPTSNAASSSEAAPEEARQ